MEQINTAAKARHRYRYQSDEEYKILKLLFGRVFIFAKKITFAKKLLLLSFAAVLLLFTLNIISIGYSVYRGETPIGVVLYRSECAFAAGAAAEKSGEDISADFTYYPRLIFMGRHSDFTSLSENILLASGSFIRGAEIITGEKHIVFSSMEDMFCAVDEYTRPFKTENTINARLGDDTVLQEGIFKKDTAVNISEGINALYGTDVITTERVLSTEVISRDTESIEDDTARAGQVTVTQEGADGSKEVSRLITKVNGEVTDEYIIDENITALPVARIETVGTFIPAGSGSGDFIRPVSGQITSPFGYRWGRNHNGTDFGGSIGEAVNAADSGTVSFCGECQGYGNLIILNHKNGYETYYGHLSKICVSLGDTVEQGEKIGEVGNTGNSTGPHLHFEIRENSVPKNPVNYLDK